jgi:hypothetical protein
MFVGLGILLLSLLFDVEDLFAVVITAGLTYSVRENILTAVGALYHAGHFELPYAGASQMLSLFGNSSLRSYSTHLSAPPVNCCSHIA